MNDSYGPHRSGGWIGNRARWPVAVLVTAITLAGCSAPADPPRPTTQDSTEPAADKARQQDPQQFATTLQDKQAFVLNVHTPFEGAIAGTEAFIPFDRISARAGELPTDKSTVIAVYCRSGRMSAIAAVTLRKLGYRRLVELHGGMIAWRKAGLAISQERP